MFAKDFLADDEKGIDMQLGYPRGYAKLCRHAYIQMQGLITPFTEGPPQRFHPYAPLDEELAKLKELDGLFPIIDEAERDPSNARRHAGFLWQQLDHLGNAGFDPAKFRVDAYGNVVYWNADPGSPLAWEVDHWFPHSRGGKTVLSNLRIVQWQVNQRKSTKLEFLVPWWDLQVGISVNQFLSVFSSKNAEFRQRAFALFFLGGENEQLDENLVVECHSWPQPFRERKHQLGLAAAAMMKVQRQMDDPLKALNSNRALKQNHQQIGGSATPARRRWTLDEEEALKRALQKFGPGNWKDIKDSEPMLVNRSTVQIKDKYRLMRGEWDKENKDAPSDRYMSLMQKEEQIKQARAEETKQKGEELLQLEEELQLIKDHNEKEKVILEELEQSLAKQRKRVEKQRRWAETQSQYRLCLEKMIRDTMHQCVLFKEQARLNQAACNALLARLESQKSACDSAEMDLMKRIKQREGLEASARPNITKRTRNEGHTDVGGCMKIRAGATRIDKAHIWDHKVRSSAEIDRQKDNKFHMGGKLRVPDTPELASSDTGETEGDESTSELPDQAQGDSHKDAGVLDAEEPQTLKSMSGRAQEMRVSANAGNADGLYNKLTESDLLVERKDIKQPLEEKNLDCQAQGSSEVMKKASSTTGSSDSSGVKRKALEPSDLDVALLRHEYEEEHDGRSPGAMEDNAIHKIVLGLDHAGNRGFERAKQPQNLQKDQNVKTKDDQQLDELLQEVLEMRGKVDAAMADAIEDDEDEEERIKRVGKFNLDRWLQMLLLPGKDENSESGTQTNPPVNNPRNTQESMEHVDAEESVRGGMIGDFFKKLSFKNGQAVAERLEEPNREEKVKATKEVKVEENAQGTTRRHANASSLSFAAGPSTITPAATVNATAAPLQGMCKAPSNDECVKTEERKVLESFSRLKLCNDADGRPVPSTTDSSENSEVAFQIACETEFVTKMRAMRERELRRKKQASAGVTPKLQDLLEDSSQEQSQEQPLHCAESSSALVMLTPPPTRAIVPSPSKAKVDELRRRSIGGQANQQSPFTFPRQQQQQLSMTPILKRPQQHQHQSLERAKQNFKHSQLSVQNPQRSLLRLEPSQTLDRSSSTPPAQFRHTPSTPPPQFTQRRQTDEKQQRSSSSQVPQLSRQLTAPGQAATSGVVINSGGAARKASMLMKSASTRGASSGGRTTSSSSGRSSESPARSSSNGGVGRRGGEGEPEVASIRRKASFFQDWEANEGLRASLSHVWKKAVKKFDLARQQAAHS